MKKQKVISGFLAGAMAITMNGCSINTKDEEKENEIPTPVEDVLNEDLPIEETKTEEFYDGNDVLVLNTQRKDLHYEISADNIEEIDENIDLLNNLPRFSFIASNNDEENYSYNDLFNENACVSFSPRIIVNENINIDLGLLYSSTIKTKTNADIKYGYYPKSISLITLNNFLKKYQLNSFIQEDGIYTKEELQAIFAYINSNDFKEEEIYSIDDLKVLKQNDLTMEDSSTPYSVLVQDKNPILINEYLQKTIAVLYKPTDFTSYKDINNPAQNYFLSADGGLKVISSEFVEVYYHVKNIDSENEEIVAFKDFLIANNLDDLIQDTYTNEDITNVLNTVNNQLELTRKN